MKTLKIALLILVALVALFLIGAAVGPKSYQLSKHIVIAKNNQELFNYIRMQQHQQFYSAWYLMDTQTRITQSGVDGTVGSTWNWESTETGSGEQMIAQLEEPSLLVFKLHFIEPFEGEAVSTVQLKPIDSLHTEVTNTFSSSMPYPMNGLLLFSDMESTIGKGLQETLNNLKTVLEK